MFADVIVDINHSEVDRVFEYSFNGENYKLGSRVKVPFGNKIIEGIIINVKENSVYPSEKIKPLYSLLEETPVLTEETLALNEYVSRNCYVTKALSLRLFLPSEMRKGKVKEQFVNYLVVKDSVSTENIDELDKRAVKQRQLLSYLIENKKDKTSLLNEKFGNSAVKGLIEKGFAFVEVEKSLRSPYKGIDAITNNVTLTEAQETVVDGIEKTDKMVTLVHGVTGSGKTEVYLRLIDGVLKQGKSAIMLVPEISLTPQMLRQLRARFGDNAAILHSGLSAGERFDEWWRIRSGDAKVVVGARSAIFAPVTNLGIIVIDEEHDGSYVSESAPRYNTLDVAKFRAEYNQAKIVLGSATPSIETRLKADNGEYNFECLKNRINKKPLPQIEIADMRKEVRKGNNTQFSSVLKYELEECLKQGNQAIIFLNQRGYSKTVICTECGHVQKCESCDVSLTYHLEDDSLLCHYCGAKYKMISACTECGSKFIRHGGMGTERVVFELQKLFPTARILRMDRDTTQSKEGHFKVLSEFASKKADILVGTQMIAKGHDFPSVTLVGILDADQSLHFSDYRSSERTFQLLTQVAGRSGRSSQAGKVVLQTYSPENPVLMQAIKYDYEAFYKQEISIRSATGFPPFADIVRVLISGEDDSETLNVVKACYGELNIIYTENKERFRFFGCMKAPLKRLQNRYRYQVLMRINSNNRDIIDRIFYTINKYNTKTISTVLEYNPNNLT